MTRGTIGAAVSAAGIVMLGVLLGVIVVATRARPPDLGAQASTRPAEATATPRMATPRLMPTLPPTPTPPPPPTATPGPTPDPATAGAIIAAIDGLRALDRYRFVVGVGGRAVLDLRERAGIDFATRGALVRGAPLALDVLLTTQLVEFDGSASVSSTIRLVVIGEDGWQSRGEALEPIPAGQVDPEQLELLLPDGVLDRTVRPFAAGYARVGEFDRNGIATTEYLLTPAGLAAFAEATGIRTRCTGRVWITRDGTRIAAAETRCEPSQRDAGDRGFLMQLEVTDAGDRAVTVERPT